MLVDMAGSENIEQAGQTGFEAKMQVKICSCHLHIYTLIVTRPHRLIHFTKSSLSILLSLNQFEIFLAWFRGQFVSIAFVSMVTS